jgi:hypothetical protein
LHRDRAGNATKIEGHDGEAGRQQRTRKRALQSGCKLPIARKRLAPNFGTSSTQELSQDIVVIIQYQCL